MKAKLIKDYTVIISEEAWTNIKLLVDLCPQEVAWVGTVERKETKKIVSYTIKDIFLPKQTVTSVTCTIDEEDYSRIMNEIDNPEDLNLWGHSHANMGTTPSHQDLTEWKEKVETTGKFYIMMITNRKREVMCYVIDKINGVELENVKVVIGSTVDEEARKKMQKLIDDKVDEEETAATATLLDYPYNYYNGKHYGRSAVTTKPKPTARSGSANKTTGASTKPKQYTNTIWGICHLCKARQKSVDMVLLDGKQICDECLIANSKKNKEA